MNKYNDNELLYLIREENEHAKDLLYEKYRPMVESKAKLHYMGLENSGFELNDLIQEGMMGLINATNDYVEEKDVKFSTFANLCVERQIINCIRDFRRNKHQVLNTSISIDEKNESTGKSLLDIINDDKVDTNPEKSFVLYEEQEELKDRVKKNLTDKERQVFDLRFEGFSYQEISMLLNMSQKSVDRTISRIKQKIINDKKYID